MFTPFIEGGTDLTTPSDSDLYLAYKNNRPDKFDELLANGADVNKLLPEYFNGTILHCMTRLTALILII